MHCPLNKVGTMQSLIILLPEVTLILHPSLLHHHGQQLYKKKLQYHKKLGFYLLCLLGQQYFILNTV